MTQITILYTGDIHGRVERLTRAAYLAQIHRAELMAALTLTNRILGFVNPPVIGQHVMAHALGS